jgi:hypothetical protein
MVITDRALKPGDLADGFKHAAGKLESRITDGAPVPDPDSVPAATREAAVAFDLDESPHVDPKDGATITLDDHTGQVTKRLPNGTTHVESFVDHIIAFLDTHPATEHLEAIRLLRKDGSIRWILKNNKGKWGK